MQDTPREQAVRARADLVTSILLVVIGIWVFYISYEMPRLEARRVHPTTIPGLVPMILGVGLALCGALLALRSYRVPAAGGWRGLVDLVKTMTFARVSAAFALVCIFTLGLVGWLPFWAAAMLFICAFVITFELVLTDAPEPVMRSLVWTLITAVGAGGGIYYLFANVFLVRLP
jgi:putative tricarboxylic transport membrane protein